MATFILTRGPNTAGSTTPGGTAGGDLSGTYPNPSVAAISGSSPIVITPASLQWAATTASPGITQATPSSDVATTNITIQPQAPFASASTNKVGGSVVINLPAPVSGTTFGSVLIQNGGATVGQWAVTSGTGLGTVATYYGQGATVDASHWFIAGAATQNFLNASSELGFGIGGTIGGSVDIQANGIQLFARTQALGGGNGVVGITAATTNPGSNPSGGGVLYCTSTSDGYSAGLGFRTNNGAIFTMGHTGFQQNSTSINIAAGGVFLLTAAQASFGYLVLTGSLAANVTLELPAVAGSTYYVDATGCTLNAHTITLQANGNNWATTIGVTNIYEVTYGGTGKLYGTALTP